MGSSTAQRIKGQEVTVDVTMNSDLVEGTGPAASFNFAFMLDILSEGYIGETTERKDMIFKGMKGGMTIHINSIGALKFAEAIVNKARARTPGTKVNVKASFPFPNGQVARVMFPDVAFGEIPLDFGSREDYGELELEWECSEFRILYV